MIETASCRAFYRHWQSLRDADEIPHTVDFLDRSDPVLIPQAMILEITENGTIFRFVGTSLVELWGVDQTNTVFGAGLPDKVRHALTQNCNTVVTQPCGMVEVAEFVTRSGRPFHMESLLLPLAVDLGRPPRICSFSHVLDEIEEHEDKDPRYRSKRQDRWLDVGCGVPDTPPIDASL